MQDILSWEGGGGDAKNNEHYCASSIFKIEQPQLQNSAVSAFNLGQLVSYIELDYI